MDNTEQAFIDTAISYGVHEVLPNNDQLREWTITQILSGSQEVLEHLERVKKVGKPISISMYIHEKYNKSHEHTYNAGGYCTSCGNGRDHS